MTYTAEFPKVENAKQFAGRITEPGWFTKDVVQTGRTVTWERSGGTSTDREYLMDYLETVGYYGSTQSRKAKLNGIAAPVAY